MIEIEKINWQKIEGLVPAIIQDGLTRCVLMLGYMNQEALAQTIETKRVTFFSRTKKRLWVKGETSGHFLSLENIKLDCDCDTLLITATPTGPVCHKGTDTCFHQKNEGSFLNQLETIIDSRAGLDPTKSYVAQLMADGMSRMAQKVGEEGVEVALAAVSGDKEKLGEETADLFFHALVVLRASGLSLTEIETILAARHKKN